MLLVAPTATAQYHCKHIHVSHVLSYGTTTYVSPHEGESHHTSLIAEPASLSQSYTTLLCNPCRGEHWQHGLIRSIPTCCVQLLCVLHWHHHVSLLSSGSQSALFSAYPIDCGTLAVPLHHLVRKTDTAHSHTHKPTGTVMQSNGTC